MPTQHACMETGESWASIRQVSLVDNGRKQNQNKKKTLPASNKVDRGPYLRLTFMHVAVHGIYVHTHKLETHTYTELYSRLPL